MSAGTLDSQLRSMRFFSDAQRNVIMNHADSAAFIRHYRIRRVTGLQEIMCGLNPEKEFEQALTRMSRWIDRRRPRYLSCAEKASVEQDPELQAAVRIYHDMKMLYRRTGDPALEPIIRERGIEATNIRWRLEYRLKLDIRKNFSRRQVVININRQLSGDSAMAG
ncbi:hypothetical protein LOZ65_006033 [Ophidiomyces ophidiicola]|nr:hypothetical protein LOZ65_006033 [Ophidiomyces ophidiicola]